MFPPATLPTSRTLGFVGLVEVVSCDLRPQWRTINDSIWQFSGQLRLHTSAFSNLSINNSIWITIKPPPNQRRNFDVRVSVATIVTSSPSLRPII